MSNFKSILEKFDIKSIRDNTYRAICPAHQDEKPSLSLTDEGDTLLIHCFAGCKTDDVLSAVGLNIADLYINKKGVSSWINQNIIANYKYYNDSGKFLFGVEKKLIDGKKSFHFYHYQGNKKVYKLNNIHRVLYRLPELIEGLKDNNTVFICEGEKDVDTLMNLGLLATTNPAGADNWLSDFNHYFTAKDVVIMQDNDDAGAKRSKKLLAELNNIAKSIKIITFDELQKGGDVTDWLNQGKTKQDLLKLIDDTNFEKKIYTEKETHTEKTNLSNFDNVTNFIYHNGKLIRIRLVEALNQKHHIRYIEESNQFLLFNGKFWERATQSQITDLFQHWLIEKDKKSNIYKSIIEDLKYTKSIALKEEQINNEPHLLNLNNTIINVKEQKAILHSPDYYFDYVLDYDYDPTADCPMFKKLLKEYSFDDENWIKAIQEIGGYTLLGELPFQKMFWFFSNTGRNGKGTILRVLHSLLGNKLVRPDFDTKQLKDNKFYKLDLIGKRLIYSGDMENQIYALNALKSLTGGDMQVSDVKFSNFEMFPVYGKIIFSMNNLPAIKDDENKEPLRKRILFLEFFYQINNPNTDIEKILENERSGIFNFFLQGLKRLLECEKFTETAIGRFISSVFMEDDNTLELFLDTFIEYVPNAEGLYLNEIIEAYRKLINKISNPKTIAKHHILLNKRNKDIADYLSKKFPELEKITKSFQDGNKKGTYTFIKNLKFTPKILNVLK